MSIARQIGALAAASEMSTRAKSFIDLARLICLARGQYGMVGQLLQELAPRDRILTSGLKGILESRHSVWTFDHEQTNRLKAAVAAGTTVDSGWGLPLAEYQTLASAFIESLRNYGA